MINKKYNLVLRLENKFMNYNYLNSDPIFFWRVGSGPVQSQPGSAAPEKEVRASKKASQQCSPLLLKDWKINSEIPHLRRTES